MKSNILIKMSLPLGLLVLFVLYNNFITVDPSPGLQTDYAPTTSYDFSSSPTSGFHPDINPEMGGNRNAFAEREAIEAASRASSDPLSDTWMNTYYNTRERAYRDYDERRSNALDYATKRTNEKLTKLRAMDREVVREVVPILMEKISSLRKRGVKLNSPQAIRELDEVYSDQTHEMYMGMVEARTTRERLFSTAFADALYVDIISRALGRIFGYGLFDRRKGTFISFSLVATPGITAGMLDDINSGNGRLYEDGRYVTR